ncbi:cyclic peptide export ABC transporter [Azovibrio restrictus]|uniref:cyclic peptide export ABC transporter n=1 Tax=Azovibrio restrictus TaxID=146938 RepID=UPI0026F318EF|nr:cyclic peptide export ABC transporter [Azovibrio restrictus]MDD3483029.1 cyclic peptide export ABC transporter [Azovibrio restrictus]
MALLAGGGNAALLASLSSAGARLGEGTPQLQPVALFLIGAVIFFYTQRQFLLSAAGDIQSALQRYRARLVSGLKGRDLEALEQFGHGRIRTTLAAGLETLSQGAGGLLVAFQATVLLACGLLYLAFQSWLHMAALSGFLLLAGRFLLARLAVAFSHLQEAGGAAREADGVLAEMLAGGAELRLSSVRAAAMEARLAQVSGHAEEVRRQAGQVLALASLGVLGGFLLLLGGLVLLLPLWGVVDAVALPVTLMLCLLLAPLAALLATLPVCVASEAAAANLLQLEQMLLAAGKMAPREQVVPGQPLEKLEKLELRRVCFTHMGEDGSFSVGPVDLTIHGGETLFITGGNGSGKSTLIKLMTGLYPPLSGELLVNDVALDHADAQAFRDHFCAVFSDFHLFSKLYGIGRPDPEQVRQWLEEMEIGDKTEVVDGAFSTTDLSSGQRKRLALISAMLEDKPVVVLDEWAADQDPHFRRKFYEELLPRMKAAGKTVIAVTHDDRYFHLADRRLHMEEGQLSELKETTVHG